jgi:hypothetical protein
VCMQGRTGLGQAKLGEDSNQQVATSSMREEPLHQPSLTPLHHAHDVGLGAAQL